MAETTGPGLCNLASCESLDDCLHWLECESGEDQIDSPCFCRSVKSMIVHLRRKPNPRVADRFCLKISENLDYVLRHFNSRWLISIIETYADRHPDQGARGAALVVSTLFRWECFARTAFVPGQEPPGSDRLYDGLSKLGMSNAGMDTHRNLFRRIRRQLSRYPVILSVFRELMYRNLGDRSSTFARLNQHHPRDLARDILCVIDATPNAYSESLVAAGSNDQGDEHFITNAMRRS